MKKTCILIFFHAFIVLAFIRCEENDNEKAWGAAQITMPQASIYDGGSTNNYPVPLVNATTPNYVLNTEANTLDIRLGVYRSGLQVLDPFAVDVITSTDTVEQIINDEIIANAALLPSDVYSFPETIAVPGGKREGTFMVHIDLQKLIADHMDVAGKKLLLAVGLANPSNYTLNASRSQTILVIDSRQFMPAPSVQNYIQGGGMEEESLQYWMWAGDANQTWGYQDDKPSDGEGGVLKWFDASASDVSGIIYQEVQLEEGQQYQLSAKVKIPSGAVSIWLDFNLTDILPGEANWDATGDFMGVWFDTPTSLLDGDIRDVGNVGWGDYGNGLAAGNNGVFTASSSTMYVYIKIGVCCGGTFNGPILIDNVSLVKVE